jgi:hypothetical protein
MRPYLQLRPFNFRNVFVRGHLDRLVKVTYVDFEHDESHSKFSLRPSLLLRTYCILKRLCPA